MTKIYKNMSIPAIDRALKKEGDLVFNYLSWKDFKKWQAYDNKRIDAILKKRNHNQQKGINETI